MLLESDWEHMHFCSALQAVVGQYISSCHSFGTPIPPSLALLYVETFLDQVGGVPAWKLGEMWDVMCRLAGGMQESVQQTLRLPASLHLTMLRCAMLCCAGPLCRSGSTLWAPC